MDYNIGDTLHIEDEVSGDLDLCEIVFIERDMDTAAFHIYVKSTEEESLNVNTDPRCENYWKIITQEVE